MDTSYKGIVLLVEDEAPFRRVYADVLARHGYKMMEAPTCADAWEMLQSVRPNIILLDLVLPGQSGLELLERIRSDADMAEIPVIILSVLAEMRKIRECLDAGADDYAIKGQQSPTELMGMISAILSREHPVSKRIVRGKASTPLLKPLSPSTSKKRSTSRKQDGKRMEN